MTITPAEAALYPAPARNETLPACHTLRPDRIAEYEQGHARGVAFGRIKQKIEDAVHRVYEATIDIHDLHMLVVHCDTWGWNLVVAGRDGDQVTVRVHRRMAG